MCGTNWFSTTGWDTSSQLTGQFWTFDPCLDADAWFGVFCTNTLGTGTYFKYGSGANLAYRVISLTLSNNNLVGAIPSSVSTLSRLDLLFLDGNRISGTVPSTLLVGTNTMLSQMYAKL